MKIYGLEDFGITESDLVNNYAAKKFNVEIKFSYYPDVESLKPYPVEQRRALVCQHFRDQLKVVKDNYPTRDYQIIGTRFKPWGITGQLTGQQLAELQNNEQLTYMNVEQVEGVQKIEKQPEPEDEALPQYYSIKGLFVAEFDGSDSSTGVQLTEERVVLVKALNCEEAKKKTRLEFDKYSQAEIFTSSYHFTKWKFLNILDIYDLGIAEIDPEGTEVYSIWKKRKLKESDYKANKPYI
ncbi:DUF4288 domain-containing protein [Adhaeribacter radiodurans]|uniref:DUF4288 domain-containing protein n=1 Tax=Adhaeribacter radiodurans TaxID=2745197 RepID=A0A7L7LEV1_9BACT|nr:DUF4288 domain-containing protein [Adhaeribacter radiodurans]QMU31392.1 DUF4288 domain-containing protein [Adhaeribacter radiodurans]